MSNTSICLCTSWVLFFQKNEHSKHWIENNQAHSTLFCLPCLVFIHHRQCCTTPGFASYASYLLRFLSASFHPLRHALITNLISCVINFCCKEGCLGVTNSQLFLPEQGHKIFISGWLPVLHVRSILPASWTLLHKLWNNNNHPVETKQRGRTCMQCLWAVLQTAWS